MNVSTNRNSSYESQNDRNVSLITISGSPHFGETSQVCPRCIIPTSRIQSVRRAEIELLLEELRTANNCVYVIYSYVD